MFDILMYLFESYILGQINLNMSPELLSDKLRQAGFPSRDIFQAFKWLSDLSPPSQDAATIEPIDTQGMRVFTPSEITRLSPQGCGLILMLEQSGMLDTASRELVIEQALALDLDYVSVTEIKLIVMMVLGAHTDEDREIDMIQELLFAEKEHETLH